MDEFGDMFAFDAPTTCDFVEGDADSDVDDGYFGKFGSRLR